MPLPILLVLVVGGIGAIALVLHMLGLSARRVFANESEAGAVWESEFPDDPARQVILSHDHHAALIDTVQGQRGIVWPMGADAAARYLIGATIRKTGKGLNIRLPDFTAPRISLRLDQDEADKWAKTGGKRR
ncbi:MAG: hypothetical protein Q9M48_05995 [Rhodobacterales bacterium]|nr:hypothetical protein [Rhodobacterales bacterium]